MVEIIDALGQTTSLDFSISYYGSVFDSDNFESYTEDSLLFTQSNEWVSFCNDSFAANISSNLPIEGLQYLEINAADGLNSFIRDFDVDLMLMIYPLKCMFLLVEVLLIRFIMMQLVLALRSLQYSV